MTKTRHTEYTLDQLGGDEKWLAIHSHSQCNASYNRVHVSIEYLYKTRVVSPSEREQSLSPSLTNNGGERSILESAKINWTLGLYAMIMEESIKISEALSQWKHSTKRSAKSKGPWRRMPWLSSGDPRRVTSCWRWCLAINNIKNTKRHKKRRKLLKKTKPLEMI